jgi:Ca2+-binding RTX toxin-like protein
MATHVIKKDQTATVEIEESQSKWVLAEDTTLSGSPGIGTEAYDHIDLVVNGKILSSGNGMFLGSSLQGKYSDGMSVTVAKSGQVGAEFFGIAIVGDDATIENNGQVKAQSWNAIYVEGDNVSVVNNGLVRSAGLSAIDLAGSDVFSIRNTGRIETVAGDSAITGQNVDEGHIVNAKSGVIDGAISFTDFNNVDGRIEIVNKGKIAEGVGANSTGINFQGGDDRLVNRGLIGGDVNFGDGNDVGDFRHGSMDGAFILGGGGDDTFIISALSSKIFEFLNAGTDTIKTTVSYTLGNTIFDSIEKLVAIGKKDIDLTGNNLANDLTGNACDNNLAGGEGNDMLTGNRGNDTLSGGDGSDDFYFFRKTGDDTITDLDVDHDVIHFGNIPGFGGIADVKSHISFAKNGHAVIDLGAHGTITLSGIGESDIDKIEFQIEL